MRLARLPSSRPASRGFCTLLAFAILHGASGCIGAIEEASMRFQAPEQSSRDGGASASRDASLPKRDSAVIADAPPEVGDEEVPNETPVIVPESDLTDAATQPDTEGTLCPKTQRQPLAVGVHIAEIALYQTVKVSLYKDGAWVSVRNAPVVQGKKSLLRVFIETLPDYQARNLRAVLTLSDGSAVTTVEDERMLTADSTDEQLNSTFSFQLDGAQIGASTQFSVAIEELECGDETGTATDARFPVTGLRALGAQEIGTLNVVVVPVSLNGRVPVTTAQELANMRAALLAYYPVPDVDVSVRAPLVWTQTIDPLDGSTWSNLLNGIMSERRKDAPADNVYYFGLMQPAATFRTYCPRGCILGLAPQTTSVQTSAQIGLGASFADAQTYETMVHELGHAHGRGHAPCVEAGEIDGVDPKFPDKGGATGTWGWDSRSNTLMPPTNKDIMGYCEPNWIGAYNYNLNATRSEAVNQRALVANAKSAVLWRHVLLYANGTARWGGGSETLKPGGDSELADVLDAQGNVIDRTEVVRISLSHTGDQFAYFPTPEPSWSALRLPDRTLLLSAIEPAL
ncbi:MAG: hypothetical protein JWN48_4208 [Myxococcaceae bacterium]|nr:hypothetical protein [Myxococcaceae bacterium]